MVLPHSLHYHAIRVNELKKLILMFVKGNISFKLFHYIFEVVVNMNPL